MPNASMLTSSRPLFAFFLIVACSAPGPRASEASLPPDVRSRPASARESSEEETERKDQPQRMLDLYDPLAPPPWTRAFEKRSILLAERVRIEGPPGLITHAVVQQDPSRFRFQTTTTPQGLLQRTTRLAPGDILDGIRIRMDGLSIFALKEVEVLERPELVDVLVLARGDAWWRDPGSGEEQRGQELRFVGPLEEAEALR